MIQHAPRESHGALRRAVGGSIILAALTFGASVSAVHAQESRPAAQEPSRFVGTWDSTYGLLSIKEVASFLVGTYAGSGTIQGRVDGARLVYLYREPTAAGEGWFELSADGASLAGKWREIGGSEWRDWTCVRAADEAPVQISVEGSWSTNFGRMKLRQAGDQVRGSYGAGATIEGRMVDRTTLHARYAEPGGVVGRATFRFSEDASSFSGVWAEGQDAEPLGFDAPNMSYWGGARIVPTPGRTWLVVLEAHWESELSESEYSYGAMLRAFFSRVPGVAFRHRFFHDRPDLERFVRECAMLDEPVVVYISSHGTPEGVQAGGAVIDGTAIGKALADVDNLKLLHLGGCSLMAGDMAEKIRAASAPSTDYPISGFTRVVDWAGSALIDFTYLHLVLERGLDPVKAVAETRRMLSFAGAIAPEETPIPCADMVISAAHAEPPR